VPLGPDEYLKRLGALPLVAQPGERWLYHTGSEVLGVLVARASGQSFGAFLRERIFEPLGMADTGFRVPAGKLERLASSYAANPRTKSLELADGARESRYAQPPAFESGGGGLVSTADDYLAFLRMLLAHGTGKGRRILSRPSVELMTRNHLSAAQRAESPIFFGEGVGWGFGMRVFVERTDLWASPGRFGWDGGRGTTGHADPAEALVDVLLTQRHMDSPVAPRVFTDFWTSAYQALAD
jgi:CubicO group peptidase (beta-lactamase class C family)